MPTKIMHMEAVDWRWKSRPPPQRHHAATTPPRCMARLSSNQGRTRWGRSMPARSS